MLPKMKTGFHPSHCNLNFELLVYINNPIQNNPNLKVPVNSTYMIEYG